jgi:hypothetical protein
LAAADLVAALRAGAFLAAVAVAVFLAAVPEAAADTRLAAGFAAVALTVVGFVPVDSAALIFFAG